MTEEEINIKIAEFCGWSRYYTDYAGGPEVPKKGLHQLEYWRAPEDTDLNDFYDAEGNYDCRPPYYCDDLNAMHEAEKHLPHYLSQPYKDEETLWDEYETELSIISNETERGWPHLTARQKAEAFVKVIS